MYVLTTATIGHECSEGYIHSTVVGLSVCILLPCFLPPCMCMNTSNYRYEWL